MKEFKVISVAWDTMKGTNQKVAVVMLSEIKVTRLELPDRILEQRMYDANGECYLVDYEDKLTSLLRDLCDRRECIHLDQNIFIMVTHQTSNGKIQKTYFHPTVDVELHDSFRVSIPDVKFQKYLIEKHSIVFIDGTVTYGDINKITKIHCNNCSIQSLEGLQYFTALTFLNCNENELTNIDITKNTALSVLSCFKNKLTNIDVTKNTSLTNLICLMNQLTSLDVTKNTALSQLWCNGNQLTSIDVTKNTSLTVLDCFNNQLTSLDVTKNTALINLYCSYNQLKSIDITKNTSLTSLTCSVNQLTSIDVTKNINLEILECDDNQLISLDTTKNTALTSLTCSENELTSIDVTKNNALTSLRCSKNQLTSIDFTKNSLLKTIDLKGNPGNWWVELEKEEEFDLF